MTGTTGLPILIQGGMGVAISSWRLARAVARRGHLGVVSGTAIDRVVASRLQEGDPGAHLRRACAAFPDQALAARVLGAWYQPEGLPMPGAYRPVPMFSHAPPLRLLELAVLAAFAEVWLAKEGHGGPVGINLLEKIQAPTLATLYGALLAGVDWVLMGAGIPRDVPGHLEQLCRHQVATLRLQLADGSTEPVPFDPSLVDHRDLPLRRPRFLAIVSSHVLAASLARSGGVDGFVVESHCAGGHNAPPRGWSAAAGTEPVYGERDQADLARIRALGLPFWLAGGMDDADALSRAREQGAVGIQIGTAFAFCTESGMEPQLRRKVLAAAVAGEVQTHTDGRGSPTGFPIKLVAMPGTESGRDPSCRNRRPCLLGYLRTPYRRDDGGVGWRCAAEPEEDYRAKGGDVADCVGRRCLCLGLMATAGHPLRCPDGGLELPLVTAGSLDHLHRHAGADLDYDADSVIDRLGLPDGIDIS